MTKRQIEKIKRDTELIKAKIEKNKVRIDEFNQKCAFVINKVSGIAVSGVGVSEFFSPDLLAVVVDNPLSYVGFGVALLTGKTALEYIKDLKT